MYTTSQSTIQHILQIPSSHTNITPIAHTQYRMHTTVHTRAYACISPRLAQKSQAGNPKAASLESNTQPHPHPQKRHKTHSLCAPQQHTLLPQHHDKDIGLRWMR